MRWRCEQGGGGFSAGLEVLHEIPLEGLPLLTVGLAVLGRLKQGIAAAEGQLPNIFVFPKISEERKSTFCMVVLSFSSHGSVYLVTASSLERFHRQLVMFSCKNG